MSIIAVVLRKEQYPIFKLTYSVYLNFIFQIIQLTI